MSWLVYGERGEYEAYQLLVLACCATEAEAQRTLHEIISVYAASRARAEQGQDYIFAVDSRLFEWRLQELPVMGIPQLLDQLWELDIGERRSLSAALLFPQRKEVS